MNDQLHARRVGVMDPKTLLPRHAPEPEDNYWFGGVLSSSSNSSRVRMLARVNACSRPKVSIRLVRRPSRRISRHLAYHLYPRSPRTLENSHS